jgi:hypothetical protein
MQSSESKRIRGRGGRERIANETRFAAKNIGKKSD